MEGKPQFLEGNHKTCDCNYLASSGLSSSGKWLAGLKSCTVGQSLRGNLNSLFLEGC